MGKTDELIKALSADGVPRHCTIALTKAEARQVTDLITKLEKLEAVAEAANNFLQSDGDYFSWTEDERHCMSNLKEALQALHDNYGRYK